MTIEDIKKFMKNNGITQIELAEKSGVPLQTLRGIFCGRTPNPRIDTMSAIENALGLGITPEERAAGASETIKKSITPIEEEMLYLFRELGYKRGEDAQRAIITVIEKML